MVIVLCNLIAWILPGTETQSTFERALSQIISQFEQNISA